MINFFFYGLVFKIYDFIVIKKRFFMIFRDL